MVRDVRTNQMLAAAELYDRGRRKVGSLDQSEYADGLMLLKQAHEWGYRAATIELATLPSHIDRSLSGITDEEAGAAFLEDARDGSITSAVELFYSYPQIVSPIELLDLMRRFKEDGHSVDYYIENLLSEIGDRSS